MELLKSKILIAKNFWWLGLFSLLSFFHCKHDLDSDEGVILEGAWNLINNRELYTDFFEFIAPGSFYLIFWAWKIFGIHYFIAKLLAILFVFFAAIGAYKISRLTTKSNLSYLVPVIFIASSFHWPIINHNIFSLFFIVWSVYFFIKGLTKYSTKNFVASGLLTGVSILFLQHKGIILLLTLSLFIFILFLKEKKQLLLKLNVYPVRKKPLTKSEIKSFCRSLWFKSSDKQRLSNGVCYVFFSLLPLIPLFIKWPAQALYENLIIFPSFNYIEVNKIPLYLFFFFCAFLSLIIWHLKKEKNIFVWLLIFIQFFLLLSVLQRPDLQHITFILFPIYCLLPLAYKRIKMLNKKLRFLNYLIICIVFSLIIYTSFIHIICFTPMYSIKNSEIILFINKNCPGPYIYAGPYQPELYFETRKLNPTPYFALITGHQTLKQFIEAKNCLEKHQPECAVLNYKMVEKFNHNKNNPVDNYIKDNYQLIFQVKNKLIYKRK